MIEHVFRPAAESTEVIPLLQERISIMREVGSILCSVSIRLYSHSYARFMLGTTVEISGFVPILRGRVSETQRLVWYRDPTGADGDRDISFISR